MPQAHVAMNVRHLNTTTSIIDIQGDVSAKSETVLMDAYAEASRPETTTIILNFRELAYMNSSGIGLLAERALPAHFQNHPLERSHRHLRDGGPGARGGRKQTRKRLRNAPWSTLLLLQHVTASMYSGNPQ